MTSLDFQWVSFGISPSRQNHLPLPGTLAGFLPIALFGVLAGAKGDRLPLKRSHRRDLFVAAVGAVSAIGSLAGSLPAWSIPSPCFSGAAGTFSPTPPASQSLTPHLAPPEHLVRPSGVMQRFSPPDTFFGAALAVIYPVAGIPP